MNSFPKIVSIFLLTIFLITSSSFVAVAQPSEIATITKDNVKDMLEKANSGDEAAIKAVSKFSIFDPKKVAEKVNGMRVYTGQRGCPALRRFSGRPFSRFLGSLDGHR